MYVVYSWLLIRNSVVLYFSFIIDKVIYASTKDVGLSWWPSGKESACRAGDTGDVGSMPESGRSSGEGNGKPI